MNTAISQEPAMVTTAQGERDRLPAGVIYAPDMQAIALALQLLKGDIP